MQSVLGAPGSFGLCLHSHANHLFSEGDVWEEQNLNIFDFKKIQIDLNTWSLIPIYLFIYLFLE